MEFYYHPLLGLQYFYIGQSFEVNISHIPEGLNARQFINNWKVFYDRGIMFSGVYLLPNIKIIH